MKKKLILISAVLLSNINGLVAQETYSFENDPLANGWTYYDNYNSQPNPGFSHNSTNQALNFELNTGVEVSFLNRTLNNELTSDYCVYFSILPTETNYNTFFPLLLAESKLTGNDLHPWRKNATNGVVGDFQNLDIIGVEVLGLQIRFVHRNDNNANNLIQSLNTPFYMVANQKYYVKLSVVNGTQASITISNNSAFSSVLAESTYTIPMLNNMNEIYIANCNGNSNTSQFGLLDDYTFSEGCTLNIHSEVNEEPKIVYNIESELIEIESNKSFEKVTVYDVTGKKVSTQIISNNTFSLKGMNAGFYSFVFDDKYPAGSFVKL